MDTRVNSHHGLRSTAGLVILIVAAFSYGVVESSRRISANLSSWDGIIGVVLGLFICAQPAANFLDLLYRTSRTRARTQPGWVWPLLNVLALIAGIAIIIIGTTQLSRASAFR
jgi:hypothetical protein